MTDSLSGLFEAGDVLERVGVDLTAQARRGDLEPVRCRDAEVARVIDIVLRQSKNNPALIGKAGVGKTAIVEGLAQRIAAGDVPPALKDARIVALDHVALLAGTAFRGQYEERVRKLVRALAAELGPAGIRVNMVVPGTIDTERRYAEWYPEFRQAPPGGPEQLKRIPLGRLGRPEDIAEACLFLASDASAYVTGDTIRVMGGSIIG